MSRQLPAGDCRWKHEDHLIGEKEKWEDWMTRGRLTPWLSKGAHRWGELRESLEEWWKSTVTVPTQGFRVKRESWTVKAPSCVDKQKADGFTLGIQEMVTDEIQVRSYMDLQLCSGESEIGRERNSGVQRWLQMWAEGKRTGWCNLPYPPAFPYSGFCGTKTAWDSWRQNEDMIFAVSRKLNFWGCWCCSEEEASWKKKCRRECYWFGDV